jgi:mRNA-degrading endonuclease RelE of RelBE toxin-antitoxin system
MVEIKEVIWTQRFEQEFKKIKDSSMKEKLKKQITKIISNPNFGKPLRYGLKGELTIYVKPYRLIYSVIDNKLYLLRFEHRDEVYG